MADFDSQALPFQIRVTEGDLSAQILQNGQPPGVIQLVGRAAPYKPIKFGGTQRVQTIYYPGNPVATQQVIGPTEKPTAVSGEWNDMYLGDGEAMRLRAMFENLRRRGLSVEITWPMANLGGTSEAPTLTGDPIVRLGILTSFEATIGIVQDVAWDMEFTWRSNGDQAALPIAATGALNPRDGFEVVSDDFETARATTKALLDGPIMKSSGLVQSQLQALDIAFGQIDAAQTAITRVTNGVVSALLILPANAGQQLIAACDNGIGAMRGIEDIILGMNPLEVEVRDDALTIIRMADAFFDVLVSTFGAKATAVDAQQGVQQSSDPDIVAEVRAPAGVDLRDLAIRYYGDPDLWWLIANFNDIDGSSVPSPPSGPSDSTAGRTIKIPRPQPGASSDLKQQC